MNVVDRIFQLKEERHLTSKDVEVGAGLANASLLQWKKGKGKPSLESIIKVALYFDVSTDYLLCLTDERKEDKIEISLTEEEKLLLKAYNNASVYDRFRIIQLCMNSLDENIKKYGDLFLNY
ncbi:DNA-binding helix-turn-helix protein [Marvinbryantia formatexigens DSM 14469]|uniref:DNA-binding helix-turn-helix protein n=1 Tax=Marvinbryantia formatexigens DSM 14469 TaxID=478749 RepID=C6LAU6_9FIRM|nr:helix-turn-helix transcriptional regulator [Marvinbryantia formatexigens]EET62077.1 DNA-binding helix-turn-helix protein [Marvinbryantia formatexigens DSM 14469]UWO26560.1 helix-turn-helix transcriptional regulator [Marvinbryantia formatexigens DSM 14469]SDH40835.1 Helix-turn-helix [Marvinbryantia formatexigens]